MEGPLREAAAAIAAYDFETALEKLAQLEVPA